MTISRRSFIKGMAVLPVALMLPALPAPKPEPNPVNIGGYAGRDFRKGDIVTFSGVYAEHPITKKKLPYLRHFMVVSEHPLKFI